MEVYLPLETRISQGEALKILKAGSSILWVVIGCNGERVSSSLNPLTHRFMYSSYAIDSAIYRLLIQSINFTLQEKTLYLHGISSELVM